jgi:outer membrane protein assembly factor BamE (lipoprotein component of BamABCDE complex)
MCKLARIGFAALLAAATVGGIGGCLIAHNQNETRTGRWVPEATFDQIKPGETTAAWVRATLGEPSEKNRIDDHSEIWKWSYSQVKSKEGFVFLIFAGSDKTETPGAAFVEIKDGTVVRKWRS